MHLTARVIVCITLLLALGVAHTAATSISARRDFTELEIASSEEELDSGELEDLAALDTPDTPVASTISSSGAVEILTVLNASSEDARMYPGQTLKSASGACSAALTDDGDFQIACAGDAVPRWNASGLTDFCGTIIYIKLQKLDGNVVFVCNKGFIALNQYNSASKQYTLELLDSGSLQLSSASGIVWRSLFSSVLKTFKPIASLAGGVWMTRGSGIVSPSGQCTALLAESGDLTVWCLGDREPRWKASAQNHWKSCHGGAINARVESDGNFVILCASGFWANLVYSRKETGFYMRLLDSGDLIVASRRSTLWTSNTADGFLNMN